VRALERLRGVFSAAPEVVEVAVPVFNVFRDELLELAMAPGYLADLLDLARRRLLLASFAVILASVSCSRRTPA
jgi:hypothetical protein